MRVTILSPDYPPAPGGVSDFTRRFAEAIAASGATVKVLASRSGEDAPVAVEAVPAGWGPLGMPALIAAVAASRPDVVVVQYVPHMYERRGLSVAINMAVGALASRGVPVVTIAHELYYGRHEGWRVQGPGLLQRAMLVPLVAGSRKVVVTVPDRLARMKTCFPAWADRFTLMPIGANLEAASPEAGARWREGLGLAPDELVLLMLGLAHPSKAVAMLAGTLDRLAAEGIQARLVLAGGAALDHPRALTLGYLDASQAACALAAADLAVLPLADGASTRRTSLMNALAAALPVVSTRGANTDAAALPESALTLVPAGDSEAFAAAVAALARDAEARRRLGAAGQALYRDRFDWAVTAPRWLALLEGAIAPGAPV